MSMLPDLFNIPGTAHCLGGCVMADSPSAGVVDSRHRVFGYKNMYICDGIGGLSKSRFEPEPDHHRDDGARHGLHSARLGDDRG